MIRTVGAAILQLEAFGQDEVDLHGAELPFAADGIVQVDVELGPVERAAALIDRIWQVVRLKCVADRGFGDFVGRAALFAGREKILEVIEVEGLHHPQRLIERLLEFALQLFGRAEEMRVVLREAAHAREPVQRTAALEAIDRAELGVADRQIAVRVTLIFIDEDVPRAVHRLEAKALALDLDRPEHAVRKVLEMTRGFVELLVHDVRRDHRLIAPLGETFADELLDDAAYERALGMPEDETAAGVLFDRIKVEFGAELTMIALRRFFEEDEIVVE